MTADLIGNEDAAGAMFALSSGEEDTIVDQLRALEAFQTKQHWPFFHRPCTLFRRETVEVGRLFERVMKRESAGEDEGANERAILHGYYGCGRSILLLQAMTWALRKDWVVISIPNGGFPDRSFCMEGEDRVVLMAEQLRIWLLGTQSMSLRVIRICGCRRRTLRIF